MRESIVEFGRQMWREESKEPELNLYTCVDLNMNVIENEINVKKLHFFLTG